VYPAGPGFNRDERSGHAMSERISMDTITLYRPVGPQELDLIRDSGWRRFPPRLPEQPIFYPVVTEEYAHAIARDWNVPSSGAGYVLRFAVDASFLRRYLPQQVGGAVHQEYWIPAEELEDFNDHIAGPIELIASYPEPGKSS
jgi:hypothetical protein